MSEAEASIVFFDTSALVKRYHREVGSNVVEAAFSDHGIARMISDIGVIECYSAFARGVRTGDITEEDFRATIKELAEEFKAGPSGWHSLMTVTREKQQCSLKSTAYQGTSGPWMPCNWQ
jgi:hypothetical protein